jgi:hypothetical protein
MPYLSLFINRYHHFQKLVRTRLTLLSAYITIFYGGGLFLPIILFLWKWYLS